MEKVIWKHKHAVWEARNEAKHGKTDEEKRTKKKALHVEELRMWYSLRDNGDLLEKTVNEGMFYTDAEKHLRKETKNRAIEYWLDNWRLLLTMSKKEKKRRRMEESKQVRRSEVTRTNE